MNSTKSLLMASIVTATVLVVGRAQAADLHEVEQEHTFVYEQPDPQSPESVLAKVRNQALAAGGTEANCRAEKETGPASRSTGRAETTREARPTGGAGCGA